MKKKLALFALLPLAGCAPTVGLDPAPHASDPVCARVLLASPEVVGGIERSKTTAQSTTAWGDTTLRCGLESPPPSTDRCITAGDVDWLSLESTDPRVPEYATEDAWTFISYGRTPAIELVISTSAVGEGAVADILTEFAPAAKQIEAERHCLDLEDAPQVEE